MADPAMLVIAAFAAGTLGGIVSSVIGYLTSESTFSGRKFAIALMTGALAGFGLGLVYAGDDAFLNAELQGQIIALATIFLAAVGADFVRNRIGDSQAIAAKKTT